MPAEWKPYRRWPIHRPKPPAEPAAVEPASAPASTALPVPTGRDAADGQCANTVHDSNNDEGALSQRQVSDAAAADAPAPAGAASVEPSSQAAAFDAHASDAPIKALPDEGAVDAEAALEERADDPAVADASASRSPAGLPPAATPGAVGATGAEQLEAATPLSTPRLEAGLDPVPAPIEPARNTPANLLSTAGRPGAKPEPSFVRRPVAVSGVAARRHRLQAAAIVGLALALVLQLLLADRAGLAANARWRPAMATLCNVLHCTLPPWREPTAFTLLQRDVRPHPTVAGALQVTATFRNDARWAQPLPGLLLTLSDVDGRSIAARTFTPSDYLGGAGDEPGTGKGTRTRTQTMLASGQSKTISMDIVEPAPRIVAFTFDFQ